MGTPLEQAAGVGFKAYGVWFRPLQLEDYARLDVWMQDEFRVQCLKTSREQKLKGPELQEYLKAMMVTSAGLTTTTPEGAARLETVEGMYKLLELSSNGEFSRETFKNLVESDPSLVINETDQALEELRIRVLALEWAPKEKGDEEDDDSNPS
jgi:hypothetical protein